MTRKVALTTLGCKVNQYESEALAGIFRRQGYQVADFKDAADVYVINTCTVTHLGDRKSRQMIRRAIKSNPEAIIVVTGCYAQIAPGEILAIPGVDIVIGTKDRNRIMEYITTAQEKKEQINAVSNIMEVNDFEEIPLEHEGRTRAFIKIQEGCNHFCSYCIVPYARGPLRSRKPEKILAEARRLVEQGFKEIVFTGIHIGAYGYDLNEDTTLASIVTAMEGLPGLQRLRLGSLEPWDITLELVNALEESSVFAPHLHIPLQSGDDYILHLMRRGYNSHEYSRMVSVVRERIPGIAITTDFIVGFPGETDEHFDSSYAFVESMDFAQMHVFKYSPRKGTPAASFPGQVVPTVKEERSKKMVQLAATKAAAYADQFIGQDTEVLLEHKSPGISYMDGLTGNYLRVRLCQTGLAEGRIIKVQVTANRGEYLEGKTLD